MNRKSNWEKYVEIRQTVREFRDKKKAPLNVFEKHREITKKKDEDIRLGISRPSYDELKPWREVRNKLFGWGRRRGARQEKWKWYTSTKPVNSLVREKKRVFWKYRNEIDFWDESRPKKFHRFGPLRGQKSEENFAQQRFFPLGKGEITSSGTFHKRLKKIYGYSLSSEVGKILKKKHLGLEGSKDIQKHKITLRRQINEQEDWEGVVGYRAGLKVSEETKKLATQVVLDNEVSFGGVGKRFKERIESNRRFHSKGLYKEGEVVENLVFQRFEELNKWQDQILMEALSLEEEWKVFIQSGGSWWWVKNPQLKYFGTRVKSLEVERFRLHRVGEFLIKNIWLGGVATEYGCEFSFPRPLPVEWRREVERIGERAWESCVEKRGESSFENNVPSLVGFWQRIWKTPFEEVGRRLREVGKIGGVASFQESLLKPDKPKHWIQNFVETLEVDGKFGFWVKESYDVVQLEGLRMQVEGIKKLKGRGESQAVLDENKFYKDYFFNNLQDLVNQSGVFSLIPKAKVFFRRRETDDVFSKTEIPLNLMKDYKSVRGGGVERGMGEGEWEGKVGEGHLRLTSGLEAHRGKEVSGGVGSIQGFFSKEEFDKKEIFKAQKVLKGVLLAANIDSSDIDFRELERFLDEENEFQREMERMRIESDEERYVKGVRLGGRAGAEVGLLKDRESKRFLGKSQLHEKMYSELVGDFGRLRFGRWEQIREWQVVQEKNDSALLKRPVLDEKGEWVLLNKKDTEKELNQKRKELIDWWLSRWSWFRWRFDMVWYYKKYYIGKKRYKKKRRGQWKFRERTKAAGGVPLWEDWGKGEKRGKWVDPNDMVKVVFGEQIDFREKERIAKDDARWVNSERRKFVQAQEKKYRKRKSWQDSQVKGKGVFGWRKMNQW